MMPVLSHYKHFVVLYLPITCIPIFSFALLTCSLITNDIYAHHTNTGLEVCKVRGFSLNFTNGQLIHFEAVKVFVIEQRKKDLEERKKGLTETTNTNELKRKKDDKVTILITNPSKICRDKVKKTVSYAGKEKIPNGLRKMSHF